jgi:hypothetical protein
MEDEHEVHHVSDDDMETGQFDDAEWFNISFFVDFFRTVNFAFVDF